MSQEIFGQFFPKQEIDKQNEHSLAKQLNESFKNGLDIIDTTELLRKIEKPILIDFNNVLVNNSQPSIPNPSAIQPFNELEKIGNVVVLTTAGNWEKTHERLNEFHFWSNKTILIAAPNYVDVIDSGKKMSPEHKKLISQFQSIAKENNFFGQQGIIDSESEIFWKGAGVNKQVAFAFMKPHLIPLIDDFPQATNNNPGIYGIQVIPWYSPGEFGYGREKPKNSIKLSDAVKKVKKFYSNLK